jgi:hypothetical protein
LRYKIIAFKIDGPIEIKYFVENSSFEGDEEGRLVECVGGFKPFFDIQCKH